MPNGFLEDCAHFAAALVMDGVIIESSSGRIHYSVRHARGCTFGAHTSIYAN